MRDSLVPSQLAYMLTKNALTAMHYRELALADLDVPIVQFAPTHLFLSDRVQELVARMGEEDLRVHMQRVFGRSFDDVTAIREYLDAFADERALADAVVEKDRFLFDEDASPLPNDQLAVLLGDEDKVSWPESHRDPRRRVLLSFQGRFIQANAAFTQADLYGGGPLIDAPTSWQYLLWKYEYAADLIGGVRDQKDVVVQHAIHTHLRNMPALRKVKPEAVVEIRRRGLLSELREFFRKSVGEITCADADTIDEVARQVADNLRRALEAYETELASLAKARDDILADGILAGGGLGLGMAAAVWGGIPLGVAGAIAGSAGLPSARDLYRKARQLAEGHKKLKRNPVGIFFGKGEQ